MRSGLVPVFLFAAAGCNSIFGSHDVQLNPHLDADLTPPDAAPYTMYVTGMTYDTTKQSMTSPDSGTATFPILSGVTVAAGPLGMPATPHTLDNNGAFSVPFELAQGVYRIIYTPPDGVPVEIQGKLQSAHFVVPSLGRPDAVAAPSGAILSDIAPTGGPNTYNNLHLFSIGTFAVRLEGMASRIGNSTIWSTSSGQVDAIESMSGGLYTPEGAKGDRLVAVDTDASDQANAFSVGTITDFSAGTAYPTMAAWQTTATVDNQLLKWDNASSQIEASMRVIAAAPTWSNDLPDQGSLGYITPFAYGGVLPTTQLPNFIESGKGYIKVSNNPINRWAARGYGGLGMPVYLPLSKATSSTVPMIHVFDGTDAPAFPTAMFLRYSRSAVVEGVTLTTGIQTITVANATTTTTVPISVGLAYTATQHITLNGYDIWNDDGPTANPITNAPAEMDLVFDVDKPATTDDCISTIYKIDSGALVPVHRFISTPNNVQVNATIQVDKSIFAPGTDYVIGISCHQGLPGVATSLDWTKVPPAPYSFSESVTWTHPFNVP
jgi:hypothetical protein